VTCCNETKLDVIWPPKPDPKPNRRAILKAAGSLAGAAAVARPHIARAQQKVTLAVCSQLLCVTPYEVTRFHGFFDKEGLGVELVYTRGGNAAMQALVGGAVDYAATSFDVAVQAFAKGGDVRRFATTGRLPLFALAVAPGEADAIPKLTNLKGRTIGVSALGNADHTMMLFLFAKAGIDAGDVEFAVLGPNLYEGLRRGQVDAGMVQEPALSLLVEEGGRVLFNAMDLDDAKAYLGGPYEFMGVAYRAAEREQRLEQMQAVARALEAGLRYQRDAPIRELRESLPSELLVGGDGARFDEIIARYRGSLYPTDVNIDRAACERVVDALRLGGTLKTDVDLDRLLDLEVVPA
jgi:NitT/TauT family transport system substrate-binding protein